MGAAFEDQQRTEMSGRALLIAVVEGGVLHGQSVHHVNSEIEICPADTPAILTAEREHPVADFAAPTVSITGARRLPELRRWSR
ncbi:hypothetical protein GCM10007298_21520 [Williamsia phyllosphaerae]|uniref:Uncharacterized protein n=1 Tax=Williamsia phyllosphaerae TaxID=885042 RepID=A0ABQ1UUE6_9NOCA|nr:hypothetical protein GCM10007298_21520 [Williamsia phyllosphaerae]